MSQLQEFVAGLAGEYGVPGVSVGVYVPELVLPDEGHAAAVTVGQLLDHTGGFGRRDVLRHRGDAEGCRGSCGTSAEPVMGVCGRPGTVVRGRAGSVSCRWSRSPEVRAGSTDEMPPDIGAAPMGMLGAEGDEYVVVEGGLKGQRGVFHRDASGAVTGLDLAGRLFTRV